MNLKVFAANTLLNLLDFAVACFPSLAHSKFQDRVLCTEPDFYR